MVLILSMLACLDVAKNTDTGALDSGDVETGLNLETLDGSDSLNGDLSDGEVLSTLSWAANSSVACWPSTEDMNFSGAHVFYAIQQPAHTKLTATVIPDDSSLDVNVYMLQQAVNGDQVPPDVSSVVSCEAGFPQSTDSNPGEEDSTFTTATTNEYLVVIGVAGPEGVTSGGFTLETLVEDY